MKTFEENIIVILLFRYNQYRTLTPRIGLSVSHYSYSSVTLREPPNQRLSHYPHCGFHKLTHYPLSRWPECQRQEGRNQEGPKSCQPKHLVAVSC